MGRTSRLNIFNCGREERISLKKGKININQIQVDARNIANLSIGESNQEKCILGIWRSLFLPEVRS